MSISPLDLWFSSLTVAQKEHIARKVTQRTASPSIAVLPKATVWPPSTPAHTYPSCTRIWTELSEADKQRIHEHCTDDHGIFITPENLDTHHGFDF